MSSLRDMFRRDIVCQRAVELVTDYLEGRLSRRERVAFERHLAACPHCTEYLAQIRVTIEATGRIEPDALDAEVRDELASLYRRWSTDQA